MLFDFVRCERFEDTLDTLDECAVLDFDEVDEDFTRGPERTAFSDDTSAIASAWSFTQTLTCPLKIRGIQTCDCLCYLFGLDTFCRHNSCTHSSGVTRITKTASLIQELRKRFELMMATCQRVT